MINDLRAIWALMIEKYELRDRKNEYFKLEIDIEHKII